MSLMGINEDGSIAQWAIDEALADARRRDPELFALLTAQVNNG